MIYWNLFHVSTLVAIVLIKSREKPNWFPLGIWAAIPKFPPQSATGIPSGKFGRFPALISWLIDQFSVDEPADKFQFFKFATLTSKCVATLMLITLI